MRPKHGQTIHPVQRQLAQGGQLLGLGVGAEDGNVVSHRLLKQIIGGQGGAAMHAQLFGRALFGRAIFKPFFHHPTRSQCSNFQACICHALHFALLCMQAMPAGH